MPLVGPGDAFGVLGVWPAAWLAAQRVRSFLRGVRDVFGQEVFGQDEGPS